MKKTICNCVLVLGFISAMAAQAEPFAPKAPISSDMLKKDHPAHTDAMMLKESEIPSAETVGIPQYPGAVVIFTQPATTMGMNGKEYPVLARIIVAAPDSPEKVLAYYKEKLPDWQHGVFYAADHLWHGQGEYEPMTTGLGMEHIMIQSPWGGMKRFVPEAGSRIEIYYTP